MTKTQVRIEDVAAAVAEGRELDWDALESRATTAQAEALRQLRGLSDLRPAGLGDQQRSDENSIARSRWLRALIAASGLQLLAALCWTIWLVSYRAGTLDSPLAFPATPLVYAVSATILLWGGRRDVAARWLGGFFLLIASAFAGTRAAMLGSTASAVSAPLAFLLNAPLDAFLPSLLFGFVINFPPLPAFVRAQAVAKHLGSLSLVCAVALFVANTLPAALPSGWRYPLAILDRTQPTSSIYWTVVAALSLAGVVTAVWKSRSVLGEERPKCLALVCAVGAGILPLAVSAVMVGMGGVVQAWVIGQRARLGAVVYASLLSIPLTTAYLVRSQGVLELRFGFTVALYRLLRASPMGAFVSCATGLVVYVARHPSTTLTAALVEPLFLLLLAGTGMTAVWAVPVGRWANFLERLLFRECRNLEQSVLMVAARFRTTGPTTVTRALFREITCSLKTSQASLLALDASRSSHVPIEGLCRRGLHADTMLAQMAAVAREPILVDLEAADSVAEWLPEEERQWLADVDGRLLVPIRSLDGGQAALIVLGPKNSGLAYSRRDLRFIGQLSNAAGALVTADEACRTVAAGQGPRVDDTAYECETCGRVAARQDSCTCGGELRECPLPLLVAGKFRVEQRIGRGGMGVVYRAIDLDLDREIAIKTLPRTSVRESMRLRREARVMARLVHPNLAAIFGLETWRGVPILIVEFLPGGTLADRLRCGPLTVKEAIELGRALAAGLASMHAVGLLHRDIKPNNTGFQINQTPKLLDFGLAQLLSEPGGSGSCSRSSVPDQRISSLDRMGTPAYAPPARYRLDADDPVRDLWSLSLVLYEAIAGTNPMTAPHQDGLASTSGRREIPSLLEHAPACPPELAAFLSHALSPNAAERPRTARAFVAALVELDRILP